MIANRVADKPVKHDGAGCALFFDYSIRRRAQRGAYDAIGERQ
jgi:hypothetical protein